MPKFKVYANSMTRYFIEVEAENEEEAIEIAREADGGSFEEVDIGDWEIEEHTVEEL